MTNLYQDSLAFHKLHKGKLKIESVAPIKDRYDLSIAYTPGVAEPCRAIAENPELSYDLTWRGRTVAVVSDGSAVLGLGNIGAEAALPVMEGKAVLLKQFGGVDAVPLVIRTQDTKEIIRFVQEIVPSFAGINLEDISAPRCFEIANALQDIGIPVFHDDQHGTAIVVTAALKNAAKVVGKPYESLHVVVVGAGAAGLAVTQMLLGITCSGSSCKKVSNSSCVADVIVVDTVGALYNGRERMNSYKQGIAAHSNKNFVKGLLTHVIKNADVVIGVSGPDIILKEMVQSMAAKPIVFALANPVPEIMPALALQAGAAVVASGRSDFPNQINNVLAFPGVFRAVVEGKLKKITYEMKQAAADALAALIISPSAENIIPDPFFPELSAHVATAVLKASQNKS